MKSSILALTVCVLALLCPGAVLAQTGTPEMPTTATLFVLASSGTTPGASVPIATVPNVPISPASANCGLTVVPGGVAPLVNPLTVRWDDPFTTGKQCEIRMPVLPNGTGYKAFIQMFAPTCKDSTGTIDVTPCPSQAVLGTPPFAVAGFKTAPLDPKNVIVR